MELHLNSYNHLQKYKNKYIKPQNEVLYDFCIGCIYLEFINLLVNKIEHLLGIYI